MDSTISSADLQEIDGFIDLRTIARLESGVSTRTIHNRIAASMFPQADGVINGIPVWLRSTYRSYQQAVLRGEYRGRPKIDNFRGRVVAA
jgi:hypothetical protein